MDSNAIILTGAMLTMKVLTSDSTNQDMSFSQWFIDVVIKDVNQVKSWLKGINGLLLSFITNANFHNTLD